MKKLWFILFTILIFSRVIGNDISWSFPSTTLSTSTVNASDPQIATDASGNVAAAWVENGFVKASIKHIGMSWGSATTLSSSGATFPRIVSDLSGNLNAVWLEGTTVKAASKTFAGSWSSTTSLSSTGASQPDIAVDAAGDVVAVWARSGNIESSTKLFGANWQTKVTITSSSASGPQVAIGGTGSNRTVVVVWTGVASSINTVFTSSKVITGTFSTALALSSASHQAGNANVAVDGNGNAAAIWYSYDVVGTNYSNVIVQSACKPLSSSWSGINTLSNPGIGNPANLVARIAFDTNGNAMALWNTSFDGMTYNIESAVQPVRAQWSSPIDIVSMNPYAYEVDLAAVSLGDALGVYMFYNGSFLIIQSSESNFSGFMNDVWSLPINLSQGANHGFPRIAATLTGNVINAAAVWISTNGSHNVILASTGAKSVVLPPTSLTATQSNNTFGGVFTEYYNTVSWTASTDPSVVGYIVFRNGVFLEEVASNVLSIIDHNRIQGGSVVYGVAAVNNQGSQSAVATVSFP